MSSLQKGGVLVATLGEEKEERMCAVLQTQTFEPSDFCSVQDMQEIRWFRMMPEQVPEIDLERIAELARALQKEEEDWNWRMSSFK